MPRCARIASTASYLPEIEVGNDELRRRFDSAFPEFVDKMEQSSGIRSRWFAPESWSTSDVALPAARQALERARRAPEEVDLIILGTDSPDYLTPATSVVLQHKLGAKNAGTFDVGCACASFPTAVAAGAGIIATNPAIRTILVVGAYRMSKLAAPDDPLIYFYGDGAGAAVLEAADRPGFLGERLGLVALEDGRTHVRMLQRYPPEINHEGWPRLVRKLACDLGFGVPDIDFIVFTQVRKPSIELVMQDLGLPMEKTHTVMEQCGYTGSACIPMALDDAIEKKKVKAGALLVLVGSGVGYNQAAVAIRT